MWSGSSTDSRSNGVANGWLSDIAGGGLSGVTRISRLNWLKSSLRIAPFLVILLSVEDLIYMTQITTSVNAPANIVELIEVTPNVFTRLVDLLVSVGIGVVWRLSRVDDVVASRPLLKIGAAGPETTPTRSLGLGPPWLGASVRPSGVRWSLIFTNIKDLNHHYIKHGNGLYDHGSLLEPA